MQLFTVDRPKEFISGDGNPGGTTATIQFRYSELVLIEHAFDAYKERCEAEGETINEDDKLFMWQFHALRGLLKHGAPDGFDAELYVHEIKHGKTCFDEIDEKKERMKQHGSTVETENSAKARGQAKKK